MIVSLPSVEGMPLVVEMQDREGLVYTGHAFQVDIQQTRVPEYLLGRQLIDQNDGWQMSLFGRGGFVVSQAEERKPRSLLVTHYSLEYVQGLEERVAQLEEQLREYQ